MGLNLGTALAYEQALHQSDTFGAHVTWGHSAMHLMLFMSSIASGT